MAVLQVVKGLHPGQQFPLEGERFVLGRHPECDIVLDVGAISRQHAQITKQGGDYYVEDLKSRNGTYVNGRAVEGRHLLKEEDEVKICDLIFTFHGDLPAPVSAGTTAGSPGATMMVDDDKGPLGYSTIMSKLDVSTSRSGFRVSVNPELKLRAMLEITQNLANSLSLESVLPKILDSLFKVFAQADRGFIILRDAPGGPLVPKAVKYRRPGNDDAVRISKTVVHEAMTSKHAILSADAATDTRFEMADSVADFRIRSMMCAPLINSESQAMGVIQIDTLDQKSRFQQDDLDVLASVAAQAAFAVENARLHEQALQQQSLERDLALAHKVQQGFLPSEPPKIAGYEFFDFYEPANRVGGDYYDYVPLPDDRLAVIVADVSGKGISAALLMAKISAEARYCLALERQPAIAIQRLNATFSRTSWEDRFVTLVLLVVHTKSHTVTIVNAGHIPPLLRRANGHVEPACEAVAGVPLGVAPDMAYEACALELAPGDCLLAFTDGISEAMNKDGQLYGIQRATAQLSARTAGASELGRRVLDDVKKFVGKHPQSDDMCLACFGRAVPSPA